MVRLKGENKNKFSTMFTSPLMVQDNSNLYRESNPWGWWQEIKVTSPWSLRNVSTTAKSSARTILDLYMIFQ